MLFLARLDRMIFSFFRENRYFFAGLILILVSSIHIYSAVGQTEKTLEVLPPDTENFPTMTITFRMVGVNKTQEFGLQVDDLQVIEDEEPVPVTALSEEKKGVSFTLVINGTRDLDIRDSSGVSIYEKLSSSLVNWASTRETRPGDAWSFVTAEGPITRHVPESSSWVSALQDYQPDFRNMTSDLNSLETGLRLTKNRIVPFGVDKVLLYITPPPAPDQISGIRDLTQEAIRGNIHVFVWMVGDPYFLTNEQGQSLVEMSAATRGEFFHFTGENPIPDPQDYLSPLSFVYTLTYESGIRERSTYPVRVDADIEGETISGESTPFYIDIQPPNPILLSPPSTITRQPQPVNENGQQGYFPDRYVLDVVVGFPDGYEREIVASRLFVDGRLEDIRSEPPFEVLSWDLSGYVSAREHTIQVEVEDALGLSARTIETPVQIAVVDAGSEVQSSGRRMAWIIVGSILLSAFVLFVIWLLQRWWVRSKPLNVRGFLSNLNPLEHSVKLGSAKWEAKAALLPMGILEENWEGESHFITLKGLTIGSNPAKSDLVLEGTDVADVQANLFWKEDAFWLTNLSPSNGTWLNYERIGTEPVRIQTGDSLHFGTVGFRFTLLEKPETSRIRIKSYEPLLWSK